MTAMNKWPKKLPRLTEEQQKISRDFMNAHLRALQHKWYGFVDIFNHKYPLYSLKFQKERKFLRTLEIGAGIGQHLSYEDCSKQDYHCNELLPELCMQIKEKYPHVTVVDGDCQKRFSYEDAYFDRIISIHVFEHLPNLPATIRELRRLLKPTGLLSVVIPCEGGIATKMARNLSARPHFEKKYHQSYDWFIKSQHINMPNEILHELNRYFSIIHSIWFPFLIPSVNLNLFMGLTLKPKQLKKRFKLL
ncbi:MAG: class I SAM-dependent methyltransferase [Holosporaceae bacterium]|jgi:SAM-dependent methyltransferase|nr:class I SAM-dependent methyltransferase [Holosporaceae bacterium]